VLLSIMLSSMLIFTSCANESIIHPQKEQTEITLSWWGNDTRNEYTIQAVQEFENLYPNIKVNCNYSEWSGYEARSRVQMISATEADVMQINFSWLAEYSADGTGYYNLENLENIIDLSSFSEDMLKYGRKNGILNAIPIAMNAETVYINQSIYESYHLPVPKTWDDLLQSAKIMKQDNIYPMSGASKAIWLYLLAYAEQVSGKTILNSDNLLNFTPEEFQLMLEFYVTMIQEKVIPQVEYYERMNLDSGNYAGTIAWVSDAMNYLGTAIENGNTVIPADYTALTSEQSGTGWYAKPATMYAISVNTEHPEESALLLDFLLNSQEMSVLQGLEKGIPISQSAREFLESENMLTGLQYDASLKMESTTNLSEMQPFLENATLIDEFIACCNDVLYHKKTSEQSAQELYEIALSLIAGSYTHL
ncbi:MAG: ABC transporter substrate-binding protein, partial [Oscillospiraceae bacterium]|nr:ABC transporter substrate-binding protein [Oscillospiraceae bacterium]